MANFLQNVKEMFGTSDLYEALSLKKNAKGKEIRRAYYNLSLKVHPDRFPHESDEKQIATQKFQTLTRMYSILSDKELKAIYDETGLVDGMENIEGEKDWSVFWRTLFQKVDAEDIKNFELKYKHSEEELKDLKSCYLEHEGDMDKIMDTVLCCNIDDEERFRSIIFGLIESEEVPSFPAFVGESKKKQTRRKRKAMKEAEEAEELQKELSIGNVSNDDDLKALILKNGKSRAEQMTSFFDDLEQKYAKKSKKKTAKTTKSQRKK